MVAHPRHRQVREDLLVLADAVVGGRVARGHQEVPVREPRALGRAGRARGVADDRDVVGPALRQLRVEVRRLADLELRPGLLELGEAQQARLGVGAHPARVVVDDSLEAGAGAPDEEELVHLLLVLGHGEARLGVVHHVLQLLLDRVLIDGHGHAAERLRGHHRPVELGPVVADDHDPVAAPEAQRGQAKRDQPGLLEVVTPGIGLPDPVVLLADRDLPWALGGVEPDELRERVALGIEHLRSGSVRVCVQIASATLRLVRSHCLRRA